MCVDSARDFIGQYFGKEVELRRNAPAAWTNTILTGVFSMGQKLGERFGRGKDENKTGAVPGQ